MNKKKLRSLIKKLEQYLNEHETDFYYGDDKRFETAYTLIDRARDFLREQDSSGE